MSTSVSLQHPKTNPSEQQLDEILQELLSDNLLTTGGKLKRSDGVVTPTFGCVTTNSGNTRTVLSWETSSAGPTRSATVTKEMVAKPSPGTFVESKVTRKEERSESHEPWSNGFAFNDGISRSSKMSTYSSSQTRRSHESRSENRHFSSRDQNQGALTSPTGGFVNQGAFISSNVMSDTQGSFGSASTTTTTSQGSFNCSSPIMSTHSQGEFITPSSMTSTQTPSPVITSQTKKSYMSPPTPPQRHERAVSPTLQVGTDPLSSPNFKFNPTSCPKMYSLPGKVEYDIQSHMRTDTQSVLGEPVSGPSTVNDYRGYASDTEEPLSWLEQQQAKLEARRDKRNWHQRSEHEKRLVAELRNAQSTIQRRRSESQEKDASVMTTTTTSTRSASQPAVKPYERPISPDPVKRTSRGNDAFAQPRVRSPEVRVTSRPVRHRAMSDSGADRSQLAEKSYWVSGLERPPFTTHQTKYTFSVSSATPSANETGRTSPVVPKRSESSRNAVERSRTLQQDYTPNMEELDRTLAEVLKSAAPLNSGYESDDVFNRGYLLERNWQTSKTYQTTETTETKQPQPPSQPAIQPKREQPALAAAPPPAPEPDPAETSIEHLIRQPAVFAPPRPPPPKEEVEVEEEVISLEPIGPGLQSLEPPNAATLPRATTPSFALQDEVETEVVSLEPVGQGVHYLEPSKVKANKVKSVTAETPRFPTTTNQLSPRSVQQSWTTTERTVRSGTSGPRDSGHRAMPRVQRSHSLGPPAFEESISRGSHHQQYTGPPGHYGSQTINYGTQPSPYGSQTINYGGQPNQYGSQSLQYATSQRGSSRCTTPAFPVGDGTYSYHTVTRSYREPPQMSPPSQQVVTEVERFPVNRQQSLDSALVVNEVQRFPVTRQKQQSQQREVVEVERFPAEATFTRSQPGQRVQTVTRERTVSEQGAPRGAPLVMASGTQHSMHSQEPLVHPVSQQQQQRVVTKTTTIERERFGPQEVGVASQQGGVSYQGGMASQQGGVGYQGGVASQQGGSSYQGAVVNQQGGGASYQMGGYQEVSQQTSADSSQMGGASSQMGRVSSQTGGLSSQMGGVTRHVETVQQTGSSTYQSGGANQQMSGASNQMGGASSQMVGASSQMGGVSSQMGGVSSQMGGVSSQMGGVTRHVETVQQTGSSTYQSGGASQQMGGASQQMGGANQQMGEVTHQVGGVNQQVGGSSSHQVTNQQTSYSQQQMSTNQHGYQNGYGGDMLTVDTSMRATNQNMLHSPTSITSTQSPPSPANFPVYQSQFSGSSMGGVIPPHSATGQSSPSVYFGQSRHSSLTSLNEGSDIVHHTPKFVRDTSKYWYKANISRDDAIVMLRDKPPGTFVVRDSNSFPGAFGLALKVAQVPPNVQTKGGDPQSELVRHFLIEPTSKGVKLKGCSNEPVFGSLAALVYQHSITPLALPCKLLLSESDDSTDFSMDNLPDSSQTAIKEIDPASQDTVDSAPTSAAQLLTQGAACNVLYISSLDMESLTGPEAVCKAVKHLLSRQKLLTTTIVHFKVSSQGVTLTDNKRKLFFRRHYPIQTVTFCALDPEERRWTQASEETAPSINAKLFGFVARKQGSSTDNACHVFAEIDPEQPAVAIVNFVTKIMLGQGRFMKT